MIPTVADRILATAVHCPSCDRRLMEAEEIKGGRLRCKSCGTRLAIDLGGGKLTIRKLTLLSQCATLRESSTKAPAAIDC